MNGQTERSLTPSEEIFLWHQARIGSTEDDRQMEALLSLIAAKTGLLLVDLRVKDDQTHAA